jgi:hypothetical protein
MAMMQLRSGHHQPSSPNDDNPILIMFVTFIVMAFVAFILNYFKWS